MAITAIATSSSISVNADRQTPFLRPARVMTLSLLGLSKD